MPAYVISCVTEYHPAKKGTYFLKSMKSNIDTVTLTNSKMLEL